MARKRTQSQIDAEARRESADKHGKTLVRHDAKSAAALAKVQERYEVSAPAAIRLALIELAAKKSNR